MKKIYKSKKKSTKHKINKKGPNYSGTGLYLKNVY